jgi:hypothetical protein
VCVPSGQWNRWSSPLCRPLDGLWRVEVVHRRGSATTWFRIVRGDDVVLDWLLICAVECILAESGVDLGTLVSLADTEAGEGPAQTPGVATHSAA